MGVNLDLGELGAKNPYSSRNPIRHIYQRGFYLKRVFSSSIFSMLKRQMTRRGKFGIKKKNLKNFGQEGRMPVIINNFLQHRVRMGDILSDEKDREMGVPQSSISHYFI